MSWVISLVFTSLLLLEDLCDSYGKYSEPESWKISSSVSKTSTSELIKYNSKFKY